MARILVVSWNYPPAVGGIENYVAAAVTTLSGIHDVIVVTRAAAGTGGEPKVIRLPAGGIAGFLGRAALALPRLASRIRPDLLVAGSAAVTPVTMATSLLTGRPAVALTYGLDLAYPSRAYQRMIRTSLPRHRAVVAISGETKRLAEAAGIDPTRIRVVPPGVPEGLADLIASAPDRAAAKESLGLAGRPLLLAAGRLTPRKGTLAFVRETLPLILRQLPSAFLVVAGDDPTEALARESRRGERGAIETAVRGMGLSGSVRCTGRIPDRELATLYRAADLFVLPARAIPGDVEGFGMVVVEAALAGAPAVVTRCGGIPDTVDDGRTGLVLPPGDPVAFAAAVVALLRDPVRLASMGAAAADRAKRRFTRAALAPLWTDLVDDLVGRNP